jgi:hypothetical protein
MLHVYCLNALSENRQIAPSEPGPGFGKPAGLFDPRWGVDRLVSRSLAATAGAAEALADR